MKSYLVSFAVILLGVAVGSARAQQPVELQPGVARVSMIQGEIFTQRGDSGDWVAATLNTPVVAGDQLSTEQRSRAEVQLDHANILRLSGGATAKLADLTRTRIMVQVGQGLVNYSILKASEADVEIDTHNVAIHPLSEGSYRILVNSDSETQVTVRKGAAEISTPQGSTRVENGQLLTIQGADNPQYQASAAPGTDDWDLWNSDRDYRINSAESWRHTNHYYVGTEELDAYGHWVYVPDYQYVWVPVQGPGWAPYRHGRWVWEPYYGWTWVSYEPWGWAPYHYGRWFVHEGNWCWWPGPVAAYPAYYPTWAPAYVSFLGFGFGGRHSAFGFNIGFGRVGNVGWLPIGPADPFFPWYGRSVNQVNIVNVTNVTNIYNIHRFNGGGLGPIPPLAHFSTHTFSNIDQALTNERVRQGLTTMPAKQFGQARAPAHPQPIDAATFREGGLLTGSVPVTPTRESLRPTDRPVNPAAMPSHGTSQRFFTKSESAPVPRPFREQGAQVERMTQTSRTIPSPNTQTSAGTTPTAQPRNATQWQPATGPTRLGESMGTPSPQTMTAPRSNMPTASQANQRPGWHSFGSGNQGSSFQGRGSLREQSPTTGSRSIVPASPPSGWRSFGAPRQSASNGRPAQTAQPSVGNNPTPRPFMPVTPHQNEPATAGRQGGWQGFTSPTRRTQPESGSRDSGRPNGWQIFSSRSAPSHSSEPQRQWQSPAARGSSYAFSRPPLDLRQPIVMPRARSSYGNSGPNGGYRGGPTGGRGSYSAPSHSSSGRSSTGRQR